jgi:hypothetical protein
VSVGTCLLVLMNTQIKTLNLHVNCTLSDAGEQRLQRALKTLGLLGLVVQKLSQAELIDVQVLTWDKVEELPESKRVGNIWIIEEGDFCSRKEQLFPQDHDKRIRFVQITVAEEDELLGSLIRCVALYDIAVG